MSSAAPYNDVDTFEGVDGPHFNMALMGLAKEFHEVQETAYQKEVNRSKEFDKYWREHFKPGKYVFFKTDEPELPPTSKDRYPYWAIDYLNTHSS